MNLVRYPDPSLRLRSLEIVDKITNVTASTLISMQRALMKWDGIGLAAVQIGYPYRAFVMDTSPMGSKTGPLTVVNPEIIESSEETSSMMEGCLSFPGIGVIVSRPSKIHVKFRDLYFEEVEMELEGIDAICFQHELDHLDGITLFDKAKPVKRDQIIKKLGRMPA